MSLLLHQLRKDLRRRPWLLGLWLGLVLLQGTLIGSGSRLAQGDFAWRSVFQLLGFLVPFLQALVLIVFVPLVIHDEPLVGTNVFWRTRPLPRGTLLRAKLLLLALVLLLPPLVCELAVMTASGVGVRDLALAGLEILLTQGALILLAAMFACVTPNFAQFAIWSVAAYVVVVIISAAASFWQLFHDPESMIRAAREQSLQDSRKVLGDLLTLVAGLGLVAHQYLTLRRARSIALGVAGLALIGAVGAFWPVDFLRPAARPAEATGFDAGPVAVALESKTVSQSDAPQMRAGVRPEKTFRGRLRFAHVPPGCEVTVRGIAANLALADGVKVALRPETLMSFGEREPDLAALDSVLGAVRVVNWMDLLNTTSLFRVGADDLSAHGKQPGKLTADLSLTALRLRVAARLPLNPGARFDAGATHLSLTGVLREPHGCTVQFTERRLNLLLDRERPHVAPFAEITGGAAGPIYLLVKPARGEAFLPKRNQSFDFNAFDQLNQQRLTNKALSLPFSSEEPGFRDGEGVPTPELDDAWLAGAELWRVERENAGEFEKRLEVDDFRLDRAANGPGASAGRPDLGEGQSVSVCADQVVIVRSKSDGAAAVVQFTRYGDHTAEYRWRYRPAPGGEVSAGTGRVAEDYTSVNGPGRTIFVTPRAGGRNDEQVRAGSLRLKWSWQGAEAGWLYFDPRLATVDIVPAAEFDTGL